MNRRVRIDYGVRTMRIEVFDEETRTVDWKAWVPRDDEEWVADALRDCASYLDVTRARESGGGTGRG